MSARKDPAVFCTPRSKCFTSCPVLLLPSSHRSFSIASAYFPFSFSRPSLRSFIPFIPCCCFLSSLLRRGCEMGGTEFELQYGQGIFLFYKSPDRFWGQPSLSLLFSGYLDILTRGWIGWGVKLTAHRRLVLRLRIIGAVIQLPPYAFTSLDLYFYTFFVPFVLIFQLVIYCVILSFQPIFLPKKK